MRVLLTRRARVLVGSAVWLALFGATAALFAAPGVHGPLARTAGALVDGWVAAPERERVFAVAELRGVTPGEPVFLAADDRLAQPLGHVVALEGPGLRVRFAPGVERLEELELACLPPSRTLGEAVALAVPGDAAARLGEALRERLSVTVEEALAPEIAARLPAFLARVDPAHDPRTAAELEALGRVMLQRLQPLLDGLTRDVTRAVDTRFDLLDRLGLVWKLVRGDGEGLRKDLLPVAQEAARAWWSAHAAEVVHAVGAAVRERQGELKAWLEGPLWEAARDELLLPMARAQRARLESEAQGLLERAVAEVVLAPGGGLRPRFASVVRTHLLGHDTPLLLVTRRAGR